MGVLVAEISLAVGTPADYGRFATWTICFLGAIAPDMVMVPMFLRDKLQGRQPMTQQGRLIMATKEISHSLPVWLSLLCIASWMKGGMLQDVLILFLTAGILGGILPDIPTHSEERYRDTDCTFLYPLGPMAKIILGTDTLRWMSAKWEYRIDFGILWPLKPWEQWFNIGVATIILTLVIF